MTYQGDRSLFALSEITTSITMTVEAKGQGWSQASLSRDGQTLAGTTYSWTLGKDGKRQYRVEGVLHDLKGNISGKLALPADTTLFGLDWSPKEDKILGALTGAKSTWLWQWDAQGASLGALLEIPNQEQIIFSASNPVWSPDAAQVAFSLRNWNWWGQNKYKTEIMLVSAAGKDVRPLVKTDWGMDASYPAWTGDGARIYYQLSQTSASSDYGSQINGDIWSIPVKADAPAVPLTEGVTSALPAVSPPLSPAP
jgi:Tol biopolymer transport system component